ncbi:hypothetical protein [Hymenobacter algoricola]|uniref:Macroglobulin domain-containing protein n=1 Tax=Hymenobacter algoricola TaxID=486267 RepID=A0ABP7N4P2_9BACT
MRRLAYLLTLLWILAAGAAQAALPPLLVLDVARFRNDDLAVKGGVLEIYATVPGQALTYKRRAPKTYQAAATLTLEVIGADGAAVYQETITLKPPVLSDTSISLKNPVSFQKRVLVPDGRYTLRGQVRDQYRAGRVTVVDLPLVVNWETKKPVFSDLVLLARPAAKSLEQSAFIRNNFSLTRAPAGLYARGADRLFFYAELYNLGVEQAVKLVYKVRPVAGPKDVLTASATATGAAGRGTPVLGDLDLSKLPAGEYTLTVEARDAKNKVLSSQITRLRRNPANYAPAGAALPR